jgi:hypothetical protein
MPVTNEELNAIARKAWRPSPQSEFIKEWMAKVEAGLLKPLLAHVAPNGNFNVPVIVNRGEGYGYGATKVARVEDGNITAINVTGSGTFSDPFVMSREEPDILAITRDVARGG